MALRQAVVLAGGLGTRLQAEVPDLPKVMAPVAGRPFLEIVLKCLARKGIERSVLSVGYRADLIIDHFGSGFAGMEIDYAQEHSPLGTGGGVRLALTRCADGYAFVINGDSYLDLEVEEVECRWKRDRMPIVVGRRVPDVARYGALTVSGGRVIGFSEKGSSGPGLVNAGVYVIGTRQLDYWEPGSSFSLERDFFPGEVSRGKVGAFETCGLFIDIGVPEDYQRAQSLLALVEQA